jgi:hypothetical protein
MLVGDYLGIYQEGYVTVWAMLRDSSTLQHVLLVFVALLFILVHITINPFQSNFSATHILHSSYLFWVGKRLVGYL